MCSFDFNALPKIDDDMCSFDFNVLPKIDDDPLLPLSRGVLSSISGRLSCFSDIEIRVLSEVLSDAYAFSERVGDDSGRNLNKVLDALTDEFSAEEYKRNESEDD